VRAMGRSATGVIAMQVPEGERIVAASIVSADAEDLEVLTVSADGGVRRTPLDEYPLKGRGGKGLQAGADPLAWCGVAEVILVPTEEDTVVLEAGAAPPGRRAGKLAPATTAVTGPVVAQR
jgi:DNA gyrase subunit A